jgi:hypothetical protein
MTELLAIVSIVSGAAVAITVPFINARLERSRLERQSRDARVEELRALLDGAVQHLWKTWTILYEVSEEGQRELPRPQWSDRRLRQLGDELTTELDAVVEDGLRIKLRTPPDSPMNAAHEKALEFVLRSELDHRKFLENESMDQERPPQPPTTEFSEAIGRFMGEIRAFVGVVDPTAAAPPGP